MTHIFREQNQVVDKLAKEERKDSCHHEAPQSLIVPLLCVTAVVEADKRETIFIRQSKLLNICCPN